eukprot:TRINITY_DN66937_c3_g10_i1.p2 TRINITY_DN66937_c3_g10~~TRINITY_DN66937_c3_g10_i1.p2  ORF type:complete len:112 (-),score=1.78 TRINITY_DN66937_c3_g10_i1:505-840(-)
MVLVNNTIGQPVQQTKATQVHLGMRNSMGPLIVTYCEIETPNPHSTHPTVTFRCGPKPRHTAEKGGCVTRDLLGTNKSQGNFPLYTKLLQKWMSLVTLHNTEPLLFWVARS